MKNLKKIFGWIVPVALVLALALGLFLPFSLNGEGGRTQFKTIRADESGASAAPKSQKGGAIFLEEGATMIMNSGTISGNSNKYGGAIYISNKATFTMTGGTIENNTATYGGAIYVASGGKCTINGGTIKNNTANVAPAIYVEGGGTLTIGTGAEIMGNEVTKETPIIEISEDTTLLGATITSGDTPLSSNVYLHTATFGTYPQTYVGDSMNTTLEQWFSSSNPSSQKTYEINDKTWEAYAYTDGEVYARGYNNIYGHGEGGQQFKDGTEVPSDEILWFKVEPINWFVLNYEKWLAGEEQIELFSEIALTGNIPYSSDRVSWEYSTVRLWLNEKFYEQAFGDYEKSVIIETANHTKGYYGDMADVEDCDTRDKVYLMDDETFQSGIFVDIEGLFPGVARICSTSDFCMNNFCPPTRASYITCAYGTNICATLLLRSWGSNSGGNPSVYVSTLGFLSSDSLSYSDTILGIRPALHLNFKAS